MAAVASGYPREFRDDAMRVARRHDAPRAQIAKDFGISDATLYEWLIKADVEEGVQRV
jgi:transposase